jgi:hypothetical protein
MAGNLTKRKILYKFISIIDEITIRKERSLMHALKKNATCTLEISYLYILFFFSELQTTTASFLKIK